MHASIFTIMLHKVQDFAQASLCTIENMNSSALSASDKARGDS